MALKFSTLIHYDEQWQRDNAFVGISKQSPDSNYDVLISHLTQQFNARAFRQKRTQSQSHFAFKSDAQNIV